MIIGILFIGGCVTVERQLPSKPAAEREGIYHKVAAGETLWRIAKNYNVGISDIVEANKIPDAASLEKNQLLFIPGVKKVDSAVLSTQTPAPADFHWPLKGKIISYFGEEKNFSVNRGIDIISNAGEMVNASRQGQVVFADNLTGYGQTVIIDHGDDFFTVYAHNAVLFVKIGDSVKQGTPLAKLGKQGDLAYLHFEVRKNSAASNPLYYLP